MADYGHELQFGTFITPTAAEADRVLALAELTEQTGLDLVTVQDHPYQPRFLDAWTLLTAIAGRTSRVTVAPNVANLPLRPPSVLARSVASLDILSGGRVELGLGAGAFWDAIAANGGPRRAPGEAVDALEEAIGVIRALWSDERGGARLPGSYYPLDGAKRGPAPVHDVGIWLGALKPRMLRLTGRLADGWWVSAGYLGPEKLPELNGIIDEAAEQAGRTGADIRRVYNLGGSFDAAGNGFLHGPEKLWIDQLTELALTHGTSVFVLSSDDPDDIRRFAEVAAGVREEVAAARATGRPNDRASEPSVLRTQAPAETVGLGVVPTLDDGTRLSAEQVWDESIRPTTPAPDPGQKYNAAGAQQLIAVHNHLRNELEQIRDLVRQVAAGQLDPGAVRSELNWMTLRQNNWTLGAYCESYCRLVATHHTLEDQAMLPQLKAADPRLAPVVDRLIEEHGVIHGVLERVDRALVSLVSEPDGLTELQNAVDLLTDTLLSHLSYEERELVEPLARLSLF